MNSGLKAMTNELSSENVNKMSEILVEQTQLPLSKVMDDIYELRHKQQSFLDSVSKNNIWFNESEKMRINEMQKTINKIPEYQKKISKMRRRMSNLEKRVKILKEESSELKNKVCSKTKNAKFLRN